jgi:general nucleoside transport system permease protein
LAHDSAPIFIAHQAVSAATPLILAGVGELAAQRSGVINVGIEGLMLVGCLAAYTGASVHAAGYDGVYDAATAGMLLAAVFAIATIWCRADQIVTGTALNFLALGITGTIWKTLSGPLATLPDSAGFDILPLAPLHHIPVLGPIFFEQFSLTYFLGGLLLLAWIVLRFTRAGLIIRALGESPDACAAAGIRVRTWRTACALFAGATAGAAGAYLSIMQTHTFTLGAVGGRGFLVLALVIFGRWNIFSLAAGCFLFGAIDAFQQHLQAGPHPAWIPAYAFPMLPYLATLLALALLSRHHQGPTNLGKPY